MPAVDGCRKKILTRSTDAYRNCAVKIGHLLNSGNPVNADKKMKQFLFESNASKDISNLLWLHKGGANPGGGGGGGGGGSHI